MRFDILVFDISGSVRTMKNLTVYNKEILNAMSVDSMMPAVLQACEDGRFIYRDDLSLADNAWNAKEQCKHGVAQILKLAAHREKCLC